MGGQINANKILHLSAINLQNMNVIRSLCKKLFMINPLKTSPVYTRAGVYGKCVL